MEDRGIVSGRFYSAVLWVVAAAVLLSAALYWVLLDEGGVGTARSAWAMLAAAAIFRVRGSRDAGGFWNGERSRLAAMGSALWGVYVWGVSTQSTIWFLDLFLFMLVPILLLFRERTPCLAGAVGVLGAVLFRHAPNRILTAALDLGMIAWLMAGGARRLQEWRSRPGPARPPSPARRTVIAAALLAFLGAYFARPLWYMVNPEARRRALAGLEPVPPPQAGLSPQAERLRRHVVALADVIGERSAYLPGAQGKAKDYIMGRFRELGLDPQALEYRPAKAGDFLRREPYYNVEARLAGRGTDSAGVWIVGAHYDTAPGTPGADDNASGVAVLLETARSLQESPLASGVRFVAFGTEEPPAFGSRDMGSYRYARGLEAEGARARGLINLEMLGYYNDKPGSQLYPPILNLLYPDRGDFVGIVSNISSMGLMFSFRKAWRGSSDFPIEAIVLPSVLSSLALSDQLNFWSEGLPALTLSDGGYFRTPHYHQDSDVAQTLDYERMARVARALIETLRGL